MIALEILSQHIFIRNLSDFSYPNIMADSKKILLFFTIISMCTFCWNSLSLFRKPVRHVKNISD